jgi:two-component system copper resistance phosphate regulon response regulator CusR
MLLLLIEDEKKAADYIQECLAENGFIVDIANDGIEGLFLIEENNYEVIVLDIMLPKLDGWSVLKKLREQKDVTPVIILTACDDVIDRVTGLNAGADDYLVKPFSFSELLARIHAISRRGQSNNSSKTEITFHEISIDVIKNKVFVANNPVKLTPKEYALLLFFVQREGHTLSRTVLAENVWDMHFNADTNIVDVAIKRLRDKLKVNGENKFLHTLRGFGYVFECRN